MTGEIAVRNPWAPDFRRTAGTVVGGNTETARHRDWKPLMERLLDALARARTEWEDTTARLKQVDPSEDQYADAWSWLQRAGQFLTVMDEWVKDVNSREDPLVRETEAVGGPRKRATTSYHAG